MLYEAESGDIRLALVGDALITRRLRPYREPRFLALRDMLHSADVSIANSETLFHEYESSPVSDSGPYGTYAACDPVVIDDLKWLGITMVSTANNYVVDYGEEGILTNMRNLKAHDMPLRRDRWDADRSRRADVSRDAARHRRRRRPARTN